MDLFSQVFLKTDLLDLPFAPTRDPLDLFFCLNLCKLKIWFISVSFSEAKAGTASTMFFLDNFLQLRCERVSLNPERGTRF